VTSADCVSTALVNEGRSNVGDAGRSTTDDGVLVDGVPPSAVGDYGDGFGGAVGRGVAGRFRQRRDLLVDGGWCEGLLVEVVSAGTPQWSVDDGVRGVWSIVPEQSVVKSRWRAMSLMTPSVFTTGTGVTLTKIPPYLCAPG
jgi:hypothetical protein